MKIPEQACVAKIKRVACAVESSRGNGSLWIDQNAPDPVAGLSSVEIYYGTNRRLDLMVCKVSRYRGL